MRVWYDREEGGEERKKVQLRSGGLSIADRLLCRLEFETEGSLASRVPFIGLKIIVASPVTSVMPVLG